MNVSKLREVLMGLPGDAEVTLQVYGHFYGSERDRYTHGPMVVIDTDTGILLASDTGGGLRKYYGHRVVHVDPERT